MKKFLNIIPFLVHWHVCGKCQLNCMFCYAIPRGQKYLNTDECKKIIKEIARSNIKLIIFTGGEPLLRQDIVTLLEFCKEQGLVTAMDTNAILLTKEIISKFNGILDRIGIPLDGYQANIHDTLRERGHYLKAINALNLLEDSNIKIKVNTVVNKLNLSSIEGIGEILKKYRISLWSLYQFYPLAKGYIYRKKFKITKKEFNNIVRKTIKKHPEIPIEGVPYSMREGTYFAISPAGGVYTTPLNSKGYHVLLGNLLEHTLSELWNTRFICKERYAERYNTQLKLFE